MNRAQIGGIELEYEVQGTGQPVVLIHGSFIADGLRPLLAEPSLTERCQLFLYHRRGFAGSTHLDAPISIAQKAADCRAFLEHVGVQRAHFVGHSYGGNIALQLALDAPDVVHSIALLEPALFAVPSAPQLMESLAPAFQMYEAADKAGAIDGCLRTVFGPEYRDVLDRVLPGAFAQAVTDVDTFFRFEMPALQQWSFTQADAGRIEQPVLSVVGSESHTLWIGRKEVNELVQAWWPRSEAFVLQGATHALQIMNPTGMAEGLAGFFARHPIIASSAARVELVGG
jgi:pimeloyl-ACP methyl ester carboxylesterase